MEDEREQSEERVRMGRKMEDEKRQRLEKDRRGDGEV